MQQGLAGLQALVRDSTASGVGRRALLLRMDRLPPRLSRPHHIRLARAALDPLTGADRARRHDLPGGRIALSWRGPALALLRQSLQALEALLHDAPAEAPGIPELVGLYDLPQDGPALLREAGFTEAAAEADAPPEPAWTAPPPAPPVPMDGAALLRLEACLAHADMSPFARRTPVCRLTTDGPALAWEERFLSVTDLIASVAPGCDPAASPWLLRRLTRLLDRRMLALLAAPGELQRAGPFALTLDLGTLLGPGFLRFDAALSPALRGSVSVNLVLADLLADPAAFVFARGFGRARGYRFGLSGVTAALLPLLNLPALGLDHVQLRWSPDLVELPPAGPARWVLADAHEEQAIEWGLRAGIGLFAGAAVAAPAYTRRSSISRLS